LNALIKRGLAPATRKEMLWLMAAGVSWVMGAGTMGVGRAR